MFVSANYLGGSFLPYDPANPNYEENIHRLAEFNPKHPEVAKYRKRVAGEQQDEIRHESQQKLSQTSDEAWCKEMLELAETKDKEEKEPLTNEELERHFADGTGPFAD